MTLVQQSLRAITRCHIGPTRFGNMLARWAQQRYADEWANDGPNDVITEHADRGLRMRVDPTHHIGGTIYWRGSYARRILRCIDQFLRPHMTLIDVGANQGEVSLYAARRLTEGMVVAFEPVDENYKRLLSNVLLNNLTNVVAQNCCLGEKRGKTQLFDADLQSHQHIHGWNEGMSSMFACGPGFIPCGYAEVYRLDDILPTMDVDRLDILKIDVEGAELPVLRGSYESLLRYRPIIVVEMNADTFRSAGYEAQDVCAFLRELDYEGFQVNRAGRRGKQVGQQVPDHCDAIWIPRRQIASTMMASSA